MPSQQPYAWLLAGATATGKTAAAQCLAERLGCAVLSADAMLVYRGMDIGTAKPSQAERGRVPYFGIDLADPSMPFSTGLWLTAASHAVAVLTAAAPPADAAAAPERTRLIVAGGTGLYLRALTEGLDANPPDPDTRARWQNLFARGGLSALRDALAARAPDALATLTDPANPRRLIRALEHLDTRGTLPDNWRRAPQPPLAVLRLPREQLHCRIARRAETMFAAGLVEEVRALRQTFPVWSDTARQAIGYAEALAVLDGTLSTGEAVLRTAARTRQLAKRQETWFRHQAHAVWIDIDSSEPPERVAERVWETWRTYGPAPLIPR